MSVIEKSKPEIIFPCDSRRITSDYGPRTSGDKFHDGVDFGAIKQGVSGDPVYSVSKMKIVSQYFSKTYGNLIIADSLESNLSYVYGHLSEVFVVVGTIINADKTIGLMGNTGKSTGPHLHFEVRDRHYSSSFWNSHDGEFYSSQDPMDYIVEKAAPDCTMCRELLISYMKNIDGELLKLDDIHTNLAHIMTDFESFIKTLK